MTVNAVLGSKRGTTSTFWHCCCSLPHLHVHCQKRISTGTLNECLVHPKSKGSRCISRRPCVFPQYKLCNCGVDNGSESCRVFQANRTCHGHTGNDCREPLASSVFKHSAACTWCCCSSAVRCPKAQVFSTASHEAWSAGSHGPGRPS